MSSPNEPKAKKARKEEHFEEVDHANLSHEELMKRLQAQFELDRALRLAAEKRLEMATKRAEMERALRVGTHYATFDEVWEPDAVRCTNADYKAMTRDKDYAPHSTLEDSEWKTRFLQTWENAGHTSLVAAVDANSAKSTIESDEKNSIWPVDPLQSKFHDPDNRMFLPHHVPQEGAAGDNGSPTTASNKSEEPAAKAARNANLAHLVPASPSTHASLYHHVAIWFFGIQRAGSPSFVQKLIHGSSRKPNPTPGKRRSRSAEPLQRSTSPQRVLRSTSAQPVLRSTTAQRPKQSTSAERSQRSTSAERPKKSGSERRVNHTGLKHMLCNMIRLSGQARYFDINPCLIIVPILSLQQAKTWQGQGYNALFMISKGSQEKDEAEGLDQVVAAVNMQKSGATANQSEIDVARDLLAATLKGLAVALFQKSNPHMKWVSNLSADSKEELKRLQTNARVVTGANSILVPKDRGGYTKPVRKITFAPAFGNDGNDHGHPAPDPLLLAVKAGVNWSAFHRQQLLPVGEDDEGDYETTEQSIAAMEEYLAMREYYQRVHRHGEIMNMDITIPQG